MGRPSKYPDELRERAVRMVAEVRPQFPSQWAANGYADHLFVANDINDAGEITGEAVTDDGASVAFRAHATSASASAYLIRGSAVLPEGIRMSLLRRFGLEPADLAVR